MPSGHGKIQLMRKQQTMLLRDTILQYIFGMPFLTLQTLRVENNYVSRSQKPGS